MVSFIFFFLWCQTASGVTKSDAPLTALLLCDHSVAAKDCRWRLASSLAKKKKKKLPTLLGPLSALAFLFHHMSVWQQTFGWEEHCWLVIPAFSLCPVCLMLWLLHCPKVIVKCKCSLRPTFEVFGLILNLNSCSEPVPLGCCDLEQKKKTPKRLVSVSHTKSLHWTQKHFGWVELHFVFVWSNWEWLRTPQTHQWLIGLN